jgi:hypothetical protein
LWRAPGADVALVAGTSDYQAGPVRYSFLVVDGKGRAHFSDRAKVWVARGLQQKPFAQTQARLETISVPGSRYQADAPQLYVVDLDLPNPGKYWVLAEPEGGTKIQGLGRRPRSARAGRAGRSSTSSRRSASASVRPRSASSTSRSTPTTTQRRARTAG